MPNGKFSKLVLNIQENLENRILGDQCKFNVFMK